MEKQHSYLDIIYVRIARKQKAKKKMHKTIERMMNVNALESEKKKKNLTIKHRTQQKFNEIAFKFRLQSKMNTVYISMQKRNTKKLDLKFERSNDVL